MSKLITKQFNQSTVAFDLSSDMMISLTDMAKANGKEAWRWLDLESTKSYLAVIAKLGKNEVITKQGVNGGTWASKRVAIRFAQWLSDEFAIWVDTQIEELLTTGVVKMKPLTRKEMALMVIAQEEEIERLQIQLDEAKDWMSIKKVAAHNQIDWKLIPWRKLKEVSMAMGYIPQKIFDANYKDGVNVYHKACWNVAYPTLDLPNGEC